MRIYVLCCCLAIFAAAVDSIGAAQEAASLPSTGAPAGNAPVSRIQPDASIDLNTIYRRLEHQEAELRRLKERLAALPGEVRYLPPVENAASDSLSESAFLSNADLHRRIENPEQRLDGHLYQQSESLQAAVEGHEVGSDLTMCASWNNGLELRTRNEDFRIHVGGQSQLDVSAFHNDQELTVSPAVGGIGPQPNSIQLRRARLRVDGTMYEVFEFAAEYDFVMTLAPTAPSTGQPVAAVPSVNDLWITWTQLPVVGNFRIGNVKEPIGMEHLTNSRFLDFIERSFLQDTIFGPYNNGFNPGMFFYNWTDNEMGTWAIGAFANNANPFGYGIGDDWSVTARTTRLVYYDEPSHGRYLWHAGISASVRHPDDDLVRLRTRGNIHSGPPGVLNPIYADTDVMRADLLELIALETAAVWGSWNLQAEYLATWVENAVQPFAPPNAAVPRGTPFYHGGYVQIFYFLTGEHRAYDRHTGTFDRVVPFGNAFYVGSDGGRCLGKGAWQIGARYSAIDLTDSGIDGGILHSGTFGLNWYLNPNAKVQFNYDITWRSRVRHTPSGMINAFGVRFAHDF